MDIAALRNSVFEKTGIRIDAADPVFTVVALNQAVLEQMTAEMGARGDAALQELDLRIGVMRHLLEQVQAASVGMTERAHQVHVASAVKAAADARSEIFQAARLAIGAEVERAAKIVDDAVLRLAAAERQVQAAAQRNGRMRLALPCFVSGAGAGMAVLAAMYHFLR